ncbi:hypothetical protein KY285_036128 [Solanum tuberosum]|nr:hypothetical protein KY285_036128 [Solanum tuberosum]
MYSEDRRFSGRVYTRRNRKTLKKDIFTTIVAANVTRVSETLDTEQPVKVVRQNDQNHSITNSTSGDVPEGSVELRENGSCSIVVGRRRLEGELDHVRGMVKKIEVKETSVYNGNNKRSLVLIPHRPSISCSYPQFTSYMINRPPTIGYNPAGCGIFFPKHAEAGTSTEAYLLQHKLSFVQ